MAAELLGDAETKPVEPLNSALASSLHCTTATSRREAYSSLRCTTATSRIEALMCTQTCLLHLSDWCLDYIGIPMGVSTLAPRMFSLVANVLANRCWSLVVRHHGPPDIYVGLFSSSQEKRSWAIVRIEAHWKRLLLLEQRRFASRGNMQLWSDLLAARNNAVRLMYCSQALAHTQGHRWDYHHSPFGMDEDPAIVEAPLFHTDSVLQPQH